MRRAMVTGGTKNDTAPMAVFAINLKKTNAHLFDELVIYHDGIKKKDQELINKIFPTRFIRYEYGAKSKNDEVVTYFSPMVFCKYECFKLLLDYDEVVWSDYDVVLLDKLDEFCHIEGREFNILTCRDSIKNMFYKEIKANEVLKYDLSREGVGTPLFALSSKLENPEAICEWCYEKTVEWDEDLYLPEQCIFGLAVQEFDIPIKRFEFNEYACYPTKAVGGEKIIHAAGQPKFWNGLDNELWNAMYKEWCDMGGSRYSDLSKKIKRKLLFIWTRLCGMRGREHI